MRRIVFIELQHFFYHAVTRHNPGLLSWPLAIFRDNVVIDASPEAEFWEVHSGIPKSQARKRCPGLTCLEFNPDILSPLYHQVWTRLARLTPQVEPLDFHLGFLDLTGCLPGQTSLPKLLDDAFWQIHFETGISPRWGGGADQWLARLVCPDNEFIEPRQEPDFLRRAPLQRLNLPASYAERLRHYGIHTVGKLLETPRVFLQTHLAWPERESRFYLERVKGPVRVLYPPPSVCVSADLAGDSDADFLEALQQLAGAASRALQDCCSQAGRLLLELSSRQEERQIETPLAKPLFQAAAIEEYVRRCLLSKSVPRLRRITLTLSGLTPRPRPQTDLWQSRLSGSAEKHDALSDVRRVLERKYGFQTVQSGSQYARAMPPRFAQLVLARRGVYIP